MSDRKETDSSIVVLEGSSRIRKDLYTVRKIVFNLTRKVDEVREDQTRRTSIFVHLPLLHQS